MLEAFAGSQVLSQPLTEFSKKRVADDQADAQPGSSKKLKAVHPFFVAAKLQEPSSTKAFQWIKPNLGAGRTLLHGVNLKAESRPKIAAFDLDGTLIKQEHWSKDRGGSWEWWSAIVPAKLKAAYEDGFSIVIISNQGLRNEAALKDWETRKLPGIAAALVEVPFHVFAAKAKDGYRKPMPGTWFEIERLFQADGIEIDKSQSFFVGDAAGRFDKRGHPTDYSSSDRKWAENVDIRFLTPEEYFLGQTVHLSSLTGWNVADLKQHPLVTPSNTPLLLSPLKAQKPELVLFVGYPCLGKTSFYRCFFQPAGYVHVNQDILKRRDKCVKLAETSLRAGECCVIDNTNRDIQTRKHYVDLAQKLGVPVRCFLFDGTEELACHNNLYRAYNMPLSIKDVEPSRDLLPISAISAFTKDYEAPGLEEGFLEIKTVHWQFRGDAEAKRKWSMWLQLDDKLKKK